MRKDAFPNVSALSLGIDFAVNIDQRRSWSRLKLVIWLRS
jgi:hypothetical protein